MANPERAQHLSDIRPSFGVYDEVTVRASMLLLARECLPALEEHELPEVADRLTTTYSFLLGAVVSGFVTGIEWRVAPGCIMGTTAQELIEDMYGNNEE
ncbi:MAG TPA: hypothetical protein VLI54_06375 [Bacillota bacterium]|nr:hypothetical protein [Bacillota bacterium]